MNKADKLKLCREKAGMTQEEVGKSLGVKKQTIAKYEAGIITNIPIDSIEKMSLLYNVSPAYIMGWEEKSTQLEISEEEKAHILHLRSMDSNIKNEIITRTESAAGLFPRKDAPTPKRAKS
jgi:transcriptional regulator with XRE-family HTH domain